MADEIWTVLKILRWTENYFKGRDIPDARLNAERLLSRLLNWTRLQLYTGFDRLMSPDELAKFREMIKRRVGHEPLQYILGETNFHNLTILCDKRALIPRPETEILLEESLKALANSGAPETPNIVDLGTGSGCLALGAAQACPQAKVFAVDISDEALALARENARRNNLENRVAFLCGSLFEPLDKSLRGQMHLIISNPPYIPDEECARLMPEVRDFEPRVALSGGGDGLNVIRKIIGEAAEWLAPTGVLAMEIGYEQSQAVREIVTSSRLQIADIVKDYAGIDRVVVAKK